MNDEMKISLSPKLAEALANSIFPEVDAALRIGRHISFDALDQHAFLMDFQAELEGFYRRYHVDLIRAPEGFFYLRPRANTLINRAVMSELEMLLGKVLCYLYLSPERLAQQGIFSQSEIFDELVSLVDVNKLLKAMNQRASGSDLDKAKLAEKVSGALRRLQRIGVVHRVGGQDSQRFMLSEAVFRFGADVRAGEDVRTAQLRLIQSGEATTPNQPNADAETEETALEPNAESEANEANAETDFVPETDAEIEALDESESEL